MTNLHGLHGLPDPNKFEPLSPERAELWSRFAPEADPLFVNLVGLLLVEVRLDYARVELSFRPELLQGGGAIHGGVMFTLLDTACVPAVGSGFDERRSYATIDSHVQFTGGVANEDLVAAGWVTRRGRSIAFCEAQVCTAAGRPVAKGAATFKV